MSITSRYLTLAVKPDTSAIRVAQFNSRAHLVVPVVAMVGDSVVWPSNADGPEFVPISALDSVNPMNWNDRACVAGHPNTSNGSANAPEILETLCFGRTFNACIDDGKLKMDAYLDVERAKEIGGDAASVVNRLQLGEMAEISIGALVSTKKESGEHNGQAYKYVWQAFVSDHLAFLKPDERGACSNKIGCGAPRLNSEHNAEVKEITMAKTATDKPADKSADKPADVKSTTDVPKDSGALSWLRRVLSTFCPATYTADQSVNDLRDELSSALMETVPLFAWIIDIRYADKQVIYSVYEDSESRWNGDCLYFLRGYVIDAGGEVTLANDAVQVEASMDWTPTTETEDTKTGNVMTATAKHKTNSDCECQHNKGENMDKKVLIAQLISGDSPFTAEDQGTLETFSDEKIKRLAAKFTAAVTVASPAAPAAVVPAPAPVIPDTDLALLRTVGARLLREETTRRTSLVSALKGAQNLHTEEALSAMDVGRLEEMYQLLGLGHAQVFDYSGLGLPSAPSAPTSTYKAMDDSYDRALKAEREARGGKN